MSLYDRGYVEALRDAIVLANEMSDSGGNLSRIDYINRMEEAIRSMNSLGHEPGDSP